MILTAEQARTGKCGIGHCNENSIMFVKMLSKAGAVYGSFCNGHADMVATFVGAVRASDLESGTEKP
jgi:hypothetical protein